MTHSQYWAEPLTEQIKKKASSVGSKLFLNKEGQISGKKLTAGITLALTGVAAGLFAWNQLHRAAEARRTGQGASRKFPDIVSAPDLVVDPVKGHADMSSIPVRKGDYHSW